MSEGDTIMVDTYEGHANRETWGVLVVINNEAETQAAHHATARQAWAEAEFAPQVVGGSWTEEGTWTRSEAARFILEDLLRDGYADGDPLAESPTTVYADLLGVALARVDWLEVADCLLRDALEGAGYEGRRPVPASR